MVWRLLLLPLVLLCLRCAIRQQHPESLLKRSHPLRQIMQAAESEHSAPLLCW
jgi:hypothetical protein